MCCPVEPHALENLVHFPVEPHALEEPFILFCLMDPHALATLMHCTVELHTLTNSHTFPCGASCIVGLDH